VPQEDVAGKSMVVSYAMILSISQLQTASDDVTN